MERQIAKDASKWLGVIFWINIIRIFLAVLSFVFPILRSTVLPWITILLFAVETICLFKCTRADESFRIAAVYALAAYIIAQLLTRLDLFNTDSLMAQLSAERALLESGGTADLQSLHALGDLMKDYSVRQWIPYVILGLLYAMRDHRLFRGFSRVTQSWDEKLAAKWKSVWKGYLACWIIMAAEAALMVGVMLSLSSILTGLESVGEGAGPADHTALYLLLMVMVVMVLAGLILLLITYIRHLKYLHRTVKLLRDV